jgi:hypothetical protein
MAETTEDTKPIPAPCSDGRCTYPFNGPPCSLCMFRLATAQAEANRSDERTSDWIDHVQSYILTKSSQRFTDGADEEDEVVREDSKNDEMAAEFDEYVHREELGEAEIARCQHEQAEEFQDDEYSDDGDDVQTEEDNDGEEEPPLPVSTDAASSRASNVTSPSLVFTNQKAWLSGVWENTIGQQMEGSNFVGGAEEKDLTADDCPYCRQPLGDPNDQHLLKCRYAYEERQAFEKMVSFFFLLTCFIS